MNNPNRKEPSDQPRKKLPRLMEPETEKSDKSLPRTSGEGYRVMLFNDEDHVLQDVVIQVAKALRCKLEQAVTITLAAHHKGRAVVTITTESDAKRIADVLREIDLVVNVDPV
ncbi:Clp protease ClpS [candidate division BRC1 bacterium HGW-BRC1-1]|jgi:ATP-dependent Clp protease adapter protein ClpS|nr:MAG: Clp protease ClpS [candidate division BRC1 bacterium HGW-BRC1-1]